jgi:alcohol dehydrogenase class IV
MRFNQEAAASHYARLATLFGVPAYGMSEKEAAARSVQEVESMIARLGITRGLRHHGVPQESLGPLSLKAFEDSCHRTNIRPCTQRDLLRLYEESW